MGILSPVILGDHVRLAEFVHPDLLGTLQTAVQGEELNPQLFQMVHHGLNQGCTHASPLISRKDVKTAQLTHIGELIIRAPFDIIPTGPKRDCSHHFPIEDSDQEQITRLGVLHCPAEEHLLVLNFLADIVLKMPQTLLFKGIGNRCFKHTEGRLQMVLCGCDNR